MTKKMSNDTVLSVGEPFAPEIGQQNHCWSCICIVLERNLVNLKKREIRKTCKLDQFRASFGTGRKEFFHRS